MVAKSLRKSSKSNITPLVFDDVKVARLPCAADGSRYSISM
jgi:hypothetical protein